MHLKEAVTAAKAYVQELFCDEGIAEVGLEEVRRRDLTDDWLVTIGFSRPWERPPLSGLLGIDSKRAYKVVCIDSTGDVVSLTDRLLPDSDG